MTTSLYKLFGALLVLIAMTSSLVASATPRSFPADSYQVQLQAYSDPYITITGTTVQLSPGVIIFGPTNSTVVRGALPIGAAIRVQFDLTGEVRKIWILNSDEVIPISWWQALFGGAFQPPAHN